MSKLCVSLKKRLTFLFFVFNSRIFFCFFFLFLSSLLAAKKMSRSFFFLSIVFFSSLFILKMMAPFRSRHVTTNISCTTFFLYFSSSLLSLSSIFYDAFEFSIFCTSEYFFLFLFRDKFHRVVLASEEDEKAKMRNHFLYQH